MEKAKRLTVKEASEILDIDERMLRRGMRQGTLPIGFVVENTNNGFSYIIYEEKIAAFLNLNSIGYNPN